VRGIRHVRDVRSSHGRSREILSARLDQPVACMKVIHLQSDSSGPPGFPGLALVSRADCDAHAVRVWRSDPVCDRCPPT
jgi:hypothetical protein